MRALVTGGAGFIGSHLVNRLIADDWDVSSFDTKSGTPVQSVKGTPHADVIFHLASPVGPVGVLGWAGRIVPEVIETTAIVRDWALANDCPLIDVSTSEVYGSGAADHENDPCTFQAPSSARKEYAVAKLAAETMLLNTDGLDVRIVRPFNVAGPGQSAAGGFIIPRFIQQARTGAPLTVYGNGMQRRAFTHVLDVVDGLIAAYERGTPGEVYNLGNPDNSATILQVAFRVRDVLGVECPIEYIDPVTLWGSVFREAPDKLPVATKAERELDWRPTRSLSQIIRDAAA